MNSFNNNNVTKFFGRKEILKHKFILHGLVEERDTYMMKKREPVQAAEK